ncbi:MAG: DUF465 domain-containing protein [Zoogloeaceae bacterium]|jgi:hypothetical protein|nr:DUF465 domain-containing protein [Zoogloeaceae bacterium]
MTHAPLTDEEKTRYQRELLTLQTEHRDLDEVITHLQEFPPSDELLAPRLKKRKLQLRDQIWKLETLLTPDEHA